MHAQHLVALVTALFLGLSSARPTENGLIGNEVETTSSKGSNDGNDEATNGNTNIILTTESETLVTGGHSETTLRDIYNSTNEDTTSDPSATSPSNELEHSASTVVESISTESDTNQPTTLPSIDVLPSTTPNSESSNTPEIISSTPEGDSSSPSDQGTAVSPIDGNTATPEDSSAEYVDEVDFLTPDEKFTTSEPPSTSATSSQDSKSEESESSNSQSESSESNETSEESSEKDESRVRHRNHGIQLPRGSLIDPDYDSDLLFSANLIQDVSKRGRNKKDKKKEDKKNKKKEKKEDKKNKKEEKKEDKKNKKEDKKNKKKEKKEDKKNKKEDKKNRIMELDENEE